MTAQIRSKIRGRSHKHPGAGPRLSWRSSGAKPDKDNKGGQVQNVDQGRKSDKEQRAKKENERKKNVGLIIFFGFQEIATGFS